MWHSTKKTSIYTLLFIISILVGNSNHNVLADDPNIELNKKFVLHGDQIIIHFSSGTPNGILTFWINNTIDKLVWASQNVFSSIGEYTYNFTIPSDWEFDNYTVYMRDFSTKITISEVIILSEDIPPISEDVFSLSDLTVDPIEVEQNGEILISVKLTNVGNKKSNYTVELEMDNEKIDEKTISLDTNDSTTVTFTTSSEVVGTHSVRIGDLIEIFTTKEIENESFQIPPIVIDLGIIAIVVGAIYYLRKTGNI